MNTIRNTGSQLQIHTALAVVPENATTCVGFAKISCVASIMTWFTTPIYTALPVPENAQIGVGSEKILLLRQP